MSRRHIFKVSSILFYSSQKTQKLDRIGAPGDLFGFLNIHSVAKHQKKLKAGLFGEKQFFQKSLTMPKKSGRGPFSVARCCVMLIKGKNFYISVPCAKWSNLAPLGFVQLCRTILVSSCGLKKRVTIILAFHFMKRRLKIVMVINAVQ